MRILILISVFFFASFSPPVNNPQYILDGNSLTMSLNFYLANTLYAKFRTVNVVFAGQHYGVAGKTTTQLIADFPTKVAPIIRKGDRVYFWEITNDLNLGHVTAQQAYDNVVTYAGLVHAKGAKIYVINFIARNESGQDADVNTRGFAVNALLAANSSLFDRIIDVGSRAEFDDVTDASDTRYYNADKLHLVTRGLDTIAYQAWRDTR